MNAPKNKYSETIATVKNCLFIILGNAELVLAHETLSQKGRERLEEVKKQVWRIDGLLEGIK